MFSAATRRAGGVVARAAARPLQVGRPSGAPSVIFSQRQPLSSTVGDGGIPDVNDTGPERVEREVAGFNREPIHPPKGAGSKAMPFEVPSQHQERVVGFEHPESHALYWFPMKAGKLHYVEEIDRYFKLVPLS